MSTKNLFDLGMLMTILILGVDAACGQQSTWKVGLARARITPVRPVAMCHWGGCSREAEATFHDIWIKVLALEDADGTRGVAVTSDLMGYSKHNYEMIVAELAERCNLKRRQIMLTYSHTHTGPLLRGLLNDYYPLTDEQWARVYEYSDSLERIVVETVEKALDDMRPATLWLGEGSTDFAVNRRNNPPDSVQQRRKEGKLIGPVNHDVPVLAVKDPDGNLRAVVFGYACHLTTLRFYQWSGDYAGVAMIDLEKDRPGVQAMFFAGCGADQNPLPRFQVEHAKKYGRMLSTAVDQVLEGSMRPLASKLQTAFAFVDLNYQVVMTRLELERYAARADPKSPGGIYARWATRMLRELDAGRRFEKSYPYAVAVWKLGGDHLWIAMGGEVVVDYSLKFQGKYGPTTWVNGFSFDLTAYMPSRRVWDEGGYEAGSLGEYGLPAMRWAPDLEDRITAAVEKLVESLK